MPKLGRVRGAILRWFEVEQRDLPWRRTRDAWAVLVSEVMLQQTQASRVAERFAPFLERFPTPRAMAQASDAQVLAAWSGLGYNRRAVALHRAASAICRSGWPSDVVGLERLSGIGPYTARAVAALAFGRPVGAVDTNVRRWLIRRFGIAPHATNLELQALADALAAPAASAAEAGAWMHASMEFGARICAVRAPRCGACPVAAGCPSRERSVHVPLPRQAAFGGSSRAVRGAILRALSTAPEHRLPLARLRPLAAGADLAALLDGLQRDGLAHRSGGVVQLGSAAEPAAATIGP